MAERRSAAIVALVNKYPVGNIQMFADKRVWQKKQTGSYLELTPMRIKVWANAIVCSTLLLWLPKFSIFIN